jgi:hypothetical protein
VITRARQTRTLGTADKSEGERYGWQVRCDPEPAGRYSRQPCRAPSRTKACDGGPRVSPEKVDAGALSVRFSAIGAWGMG